jgi:hypothetical protein
MTVIADIIAKGYLFRRGAANIRVQCGQPDMLVHERAVRAQPDGLRVSELFDKRITTFVPP